MGVVGDKTPWWTEQQYDAFRAEILADSEGGALGVYEVWWTANTRFPEHALSDRLMLAEAVVADLVHGHVATLCRGGRWTGKAHDHTVLAPEDLLSVLREWSTWVPQDDEVVWMLIE